MYRDFAAINDLDATEQHRLLNHGDGPERLWAAWALALRVGADIVPLMDRAKLPEASSGIRCHVIVVLAGLGQRHLLPVIAREDRSVDVRSTAATYFIRTAPSPSSSDSLALASWGLARGPIQLREAILTEHEAGRIAIPEAELLPLLSDEAASVRQLAIACLATGDRPSEAATSAICDALVSERNSEIASALLARIPLTSISALIESLSSAEPERIVDVLALLHDAAIAIPWDALEPLATVRDIAVFRSV